MIINSIKVTEMTIVICYYSGRCVVFTHCLVNVIPCLRVMTNFIIDNSIVPQRKVVAWCILFAIGLSICIWWCIVARPLSLLQHKIVVAHGSCWSVYRYFSDLRFFYCRVFICPCRKLNGNDRFDINSLLQNFRTTKLCVPILVEMNTNYQMVKYFDNLINLLKLEES